MPAELPPMGPALAEGFAEAMAGLVSGLAVVTAGGPDGRPRGLLVSSLCSYSMRPPSLLMSVNRATRSYAALLSSAEFGVHLLGRDQDLLAGVFCSRREDKFRRRPVAVDRRGAPAGRCGRLPSLRHGAGSSSTATMRSSSARWPTSG